MKGGAHPSPPAALSFPTSKKVPIYCWVDRESFPVVVWRSPASNLRPYGDFLHRNRAALTTRPRCLSFYQAQQHMHELRMHSEKISSRLFPFTCITLSINCIQTMNNYQHSILFYPITLEGRPGTTDEFATIPFHLDLFSVALVELAKSIPVHSLILSSHLFSCLPLFLFPFTVPCRIVFAKSEDLAKWPNHLSFRFLTRVRSSSYSPMAAWIFLRTSSLATWSLYEMFNSPR